MRVTFCFILFQLISLGAIAQNVTIKSSPEVTNTYPDNFWTQNLGSDETGHYLIRDIGPPTNPEIILEKYDLNFKLLFSKNIESSSGVLGNSKNHFKTILGNGEILVFLASWNKERGESGLWVKRLSLEGEPLGEEIQLISNKDKSIFKSSDYLVAISNNGKKLAVLIEPTFDKKAMESFGLSVFNIADFIKTSEKEFTFNIEMERYPKNRVLVNNQGVAFGFKEVRVSGKEFKYFLASVGENTNYQEELNFKEDQMNQSKFIINKKGELIGVGLLAEAKKYTTSWQKTWQLKANAAGIQQSKVEPLRTELLSHFMNEKRATKEGASINYFVLKDLLEKPQGGYLLLTEQLDKRQIALPTGSNQQPAYNYTFNYGGIILISFAENGGRDWSIFYDKTQKVESLNPDMQMGSFAYGIFNNQVEIIWNYTEIRSTIPFPKWHWIDKSGAKIAVVDVFGAEAGYPTFLTSVNLNDGSLNYTERTFSSLPLADIQRENNFQMAVDPSIFFISPKGITVLSRMKGLSPKKVKFSTIEFE